MQVKPPPEGEKRLPEQKVPMQQAMEAITRWMDAKKINRLRREENTEAIKTLAQALAMGTIELSPDNLITHHLLFPIQPASGNLVVQFQYRLHLNLGAFKLRFGNTYRRPEAHTLVTDYASVITGQLIKVLDQVDTADKQIMQAIVTFYI